MEVKTAILRLRFRLWKKRTPTRSCRRQRVRRHNG
ncbi:unnamed protein product [Linum tenue]|uniref:Uncharacterized protein n=1 Tax=Linum tenue TaxID=586396 RepID=A0AAV0LH08_9ROSI|nr:unnamed protein product [Linum tenue]